MRYARSLGFLDWANQPDPFRRYAGAPLFALPLQADGPDDPAYDALYVPGLIRPRPITIETLSRFLEFALSVTAWKQAGDMQWALRSNPSSGNLHPTEGYVVIPAVSGESSPESWPAGVYHYAPKEHGLECRAPLAPEATAALLSPFPDGSFLFGLSSVHWREAWKYGERAFRYCQHDIGHALGSARLAAAALGWRMVLLSGMSTAQVARVLGVDRDDEFQAVEREQADCLAVVFPEPGAGALRLPRTLAEQAIEGVAASHWQGIPNRLSRDQPIRWDLIDEASEATVKPVTSEADREVRPADPTAPSSVLRTATAPTIIRQRRSAVSFDGTTGLPAATWYHMLARLLPSHGNSSQACPPWDLDDRAPRVHLMLFVHLVEGVSPGLYCLARRRDVVPLLKQVLRPDFLWTSPPGCPSDVPLYCLAEGDARRVAAQVSCHQDIAGASAFSLGMFAEYADPLASEGAHAYPRLFWECGLIGQVLYLEAEAAGVRGTGIGCFFDDPVHEVFGLGDEAVQSLYHFTVGGPVEDRRLTTLPPYPGRGRR